MSDNQAIHMSHVGKKYRRGVIDSGTLRGDLQRWWAKRRGLEDPYSKVGAAAKDGPVGEEFYALSDINLDIQKGEAVGIIGHNGAGKSTLLKLLSQVTGPTEGTICINGRITSMLEVGVGFHGELTGRENIYLNGAILGMTRKQVDEKIEDIIEFSECRDFIDTPVKRYSSGMYVKLAFAVASHLDSEITIMDEVLAVGDMAFQQKCLQKMSDASRLEGKTVLYVSHNMNTIRQLCTRCIVLDHGKIIFDGDVEEAVAIYMDRGVEEYKAYLDVSNIHRPPNVQGGARMEALIFEERDNRNVYVCKEPMKFTLKWHNTGHLSDVRCRLIIRYQDDSPVGLMQSEPIPRADGEVNETTFSVDTSMLAEGKYFFSIALYQSDHVGGSIILDHLSRISMFEVMNDTADADALSWEHRWWGSVKFPALEITKNNI